MILVKRKNKDDFVKKIEGETKSVGWKQAESGFFQDLQQFFQRM